MEDQLISFETAKLAKEVGFDEMCFKWYNNIRNIEEYPTSNLNSVVVASYCAAPTQSLLQKWLREVHNYCVSVWYDSCWCCEIIFIPDSEDVWTNFYTDNPTTYEIALEQGLLECLKLIKK